MEKFQDTLRMENAGIELSQLKANYVLLDIRELHERHLKGGLTGAVSKPLSQINFQTLKTEFADETVVVYCKSSYRSAKIIEKLNYPDNFRYLKGGLDSLES